MEKWGSTSPCKSRTLGSICAIQFPIRRPTINQVQMCNRAENLGSLERTLAVVGRMAPTESYLCFQNMCSTMAHSRKGGNLTKFRIKSNVFYFTDWCLDEVFMRQSTVPASRGKTPLTLRWLMSYIYGAPILDVSRSHTTTQHSR